MDELTQVVLDFQDGRLAENEATAQVAVFLFRYLEERYGNQEDDNSDLLAEFYPRISRMIRKFRFQGVPFSHYLKRSVSMQKRSINLKRWKERREEYVICQTETHSVMESLDTVDPWVDLVISDPHQLDSVQGPFQKLARRRVLMAALRSALFLKEEQIEQVALWSQTDLSWLQGWIYRIKSRMEPKWERLQDLVKRRSQLFSRRLLVEKELSTVGDPADRIRLMELDQKLRVCQERLAQNIQSLQIVPTHLDLAKILNLPKGTVDSCLYYLKKSWEEGYIQTHDPSGHQQPAQKTRIPRHDRRPGNGPEAPAACRNRTGRLGPRRNR